MERAKSASIQKALEQLTLRLGADAFQVADHWEADLGAVGVAGVSDVQRLVYFCQRQDDPTRYDAFLEVAPAVGSELPYAEAGEFENLTVDDLVRVIADHLGVDPRR
jgi:hypothetical protein